jgi:hypothetical protein
MLICTRKPKLEQKTAAMRILVVDHVEKPQEVEASGF